ncbi:carbonic anhydrase [Clohesyomyces aquaticus]|uniref:Carbonic anhydrase n=1 Tax=Clohesyomyces aquaticus TaxID=1231657 RepID=A0A1Y2A8L6_9PLEO|nr:carbonic anhydrase [Clohesyomyces aquaticus]
MPSITLADLLERNKVYAQNHQGFPTIAEALAAGGVFETTLVLTCVDFRVNPDKFLQTQPQDQILVARTPAGRVDAAFVQEVMLFEAFLGLKSVVVIHHTGNYFKNDEIRKFHKDRLPDHEEIDHMVFGAFDNLEQSVRDDVHILKTSPYIPKKLADNTYGFVYDIHSGLLTAVD